MFFPWTLHWFSTAWLKFQLFRLFYGVTLSLLLPTLVGLGMIYNLTIDNRPLKSTQIKPGWISFKMEKLWVAVGRRMTQQAQKERERFLNSFLKTRSELSQLGIRGALPGLSESALRFGGTYGRLPEVYIDPYSVAVFPTPIAAPHRSSWYQTSLLALRFLQRLHQARSELERIHALRKRQSEIREVFERLTSFWNELNSEYESLAEQIRYLEAWLPSLEAEFYRERAQGHSPHPTSLIEEFFEAEFFEPDSETDHEPYQRLRDLLKPRRVMRPGYLPEDLEDVPAGLITVAITTDVRDRRFLSELENAVDLHWNQSDWALRKKISFHIQWKIVPPNVEFALGKQSLAQHLQHFPPDQAILTTGALNTHVRNHFRNSLQNSALILGPGRTTPRTLAHEFGHLLGFSDCYIRTLSSQGIFGIAVLEWNNPFYPDDLMCDNAVGEPRVEVW